MIAETLEETSEFDAEKFSAMPNVVQVEEIAESIDETLEELEVEESSEPTQEQSDEAAARALYEELEPELLYQPQPQPEPEPTPEQNLFYEQPESNEQPKAESSKDGWSGSLF
jgi:hypothetical protein